MLLIPNRRGGRRPVLRTIGIGMAVMTLLAGCGTADERSPAGTSRPSIVVTYSVLGSLVREAVGGAADVTVLIPNGSDPHEWEPSAKDIARVNKASLIVRNGLDLEGGLQDALDRARAKGVATFVASDHITIRHVGDGEGLPNGDPDQAAGVEDPHLWMDPLTLRGVMTALGPVLALQGIDVASGIDRVNSELGALNDEVAAILAKVPAADRKLVTGHESLGYFAERYGFRLIGAIIPSLTSQAGVSASELSKLKEAVRSEHVRAIFTEMGTPKQVAEAIGSETGAKVVELASHNLPDDGSYATFLREDAPRKIAAALNGSSGERDVNVNAWLLAPFADNEFMRFALVAGVLVAVLCAVAGTFVVLRGLAFIGDALAHGVLPGVAGALLLGAPGMLGAAIGSAVMIAGVSFVMRRSGLSSDTAIGLLFVGMLALGVIIVSRSDSFNGDIVRILFGEILGIRPRNLVVLAIATAVVSGVVALFARPFLLLCFDPEQADVAGFPSWRYHTAMLVVIATTVVVSFQAVGTLLVFGMLIAPAGAGALLARRIAAMMAWAAGIGSLCVYVGLLLSYHFDLSASATVVFTTVCAFFVVLGVQLSRQRLATIADAPSSNPPDAVAS